MQQEPNFVFPIPQSQEMCKKEKNLPFKHLHIFMSTNQAQAILDNEWDQDLISQDTILSNLPELQDTNRSDINFQILNLNNEDLNQDHLACNQFYMVFLNSINDHFSDTFLPDFDLRIRPESGMLLYWNTRVVSPIIHESPDLAEDKYVLAISCGKKSSDNAGSTDLPKVSIIKNLDNLPLYTQKGFEVFTVPEKTWTNITQEYNRLKNSFSDEYESDSNSSLETLFDSNIFSIATATAFISDSLRTQLLIDLLPLAEAWSKEQLEPVNTFGIRSFRRGTQTQYSRDNLECNIISVLIKVDEISNKSWPLTFQVRSGETQQVDFPPGSMCFYEGAKLEYGFPERLDGEFSRYIYVHYLPKSLQARR